MWLIENGNPIPAIKNHQKIESFISQCLRGDWVIRIEHKNHEQDSQMGWFQWENSFFAIDDAKAVLKAISACHIAYPSHSIRIYAEKFMPEMRMVYCIYDALATESIRKDVHSPGKSRLVANQRWSQVSNSSKPAGAWRYIAAAGTVAGSIALWQAASG